MERGREAETVAAATVLRYGWVSRNTIASCPGHTEEKRKVVGGSEGGGRRGKWGGECRGDVENCQCGHCGLCASLALGLVVPCVA